MFLVVFVTFAVALLSLFTQVAMMQAKRVQDSQNALASYMQTWHGAAAHTAHLFAGQINNISASGCSLTYMNAIPGRANQPMCTTGTVPAVVVGAVPAGYAGSTLPPGYGASGIRYNFASFIYYPMATQPYVVTYVGDQNPTTGFAAVPDLYGQPTGYSIAQLGTMFRRGQQNSPFYGYVQNNTLVISTPGSPVGSSLSYAMPGVVPNGAFALISPL